MTAGQIVGALMIAAIFMAMLVGMWKDLGFRDAMLAWAIIFGITGWIVCAEWLICR